MMMFNEVKAYLNQSFMFPTVLEFALKRLQILVGSLLVWFIVPMLGMGC